jgi:ribosomal protein S8
MKVSDKLSKVGDSLTVNMYDNGYMVEVSGRDTDGNWSTAKVVCSTLEQVVSVITEAATVIPRDN